MTLPHETKEHGQEGGEAKETVKTETTVERTEQGGDEAGQGDGGLEAEDSQIERAARGDAAEGEGGE